MWSTCRRVGLWFWRPPSTAFDTLDSLTASTWHLAPSHLDSWVDSDQKGPLLPEPVNPRNLYLFNSLLACYFLRLAIYAGIYHLYEDRGSKQLRLPYYWGDIFQLLTEHAFYINMGASLSALYCFITSTRFHLQKLLVKRIKSLSWFRILIYIEATMRLNYRTSYYSFKLLHAVSRNQYKRYGAKFQRALTLRVLCIKCHFIALFLFFMAVMCRVLSHPEWGHSILFTIVMDIACQVWFFHWFRVILSVQVLLYLNSTFTTMLLESIEERLSRVTSDIGILRLMHHFNQTIHLMAQVNRFWQCPLRDYCLLMTPSLMIAIHVLLFIPTDPIFYNTLVYVVCMCMLTLHLNNWIAAGVRTTGQRLYRAIYHRGIIMSPNLTLSTKFKVVLPQLIRMEFSNFLAFEDYQYDTDNLFHVGTVWRTNWSSRCS